MSDESLRAPEGSKCKWKDRRSGHPCGKPAETIEVVKCHDYTFEAKICSEHKWAINRILMRHGFDVAFSRKDNGTRQKAYVAASGMPFKAADVRRWMEQTGGSGPSHGRVSNAMIEAFADSH
jgi:hypothetical protein